MKLLELKVNGLFAHFDHVIKLNNEENITIITAPNGYGKTTILKIINAIFNEKFNYLLTLEFSSIEVKTDCGILSITRHVQEDDTFIEFKLLDSNNKEFKFNSSSYDNYLEKFPRSSIDRHFPWLDRVASKEWMDNNTGNIIDLNEVFQLYSDYLPRREYPLNLPLDDWLIEFKNSLNIHLIQDQRLIQRIGSHGTKKNHNRVFDTIKKYASELSDEIQHIAVKSSEISQSLDNSFPTRLLDKHKTSNTLNIDELKIKLNTLNTKREQLSSHSLIASDHSSQVVAFNEIKEEDTNVLSLYANDAEDKLEIYNDILQRVDLFTGILNKKRLAFKQIKIDREEGFVFVTDKNNPLQLTQLSSGEQHEVVLLYELIFRAKNNVLVLIDEPEISLHIAWQKEFLTDLKRIIKLQNISAIISTHSPQIIGNDWDLVVELKGEIKK